MALSRDRGTQSQRVDQGYGVVCDEAGSPLPGLLVTGANQKHGIVQVRPGSGASLPELPVGTRLRILPNHACATAAQFDEYPVLSADRPGELPCWERVRGWCCRKRRSVSIFPEKRRRARPTSCRGSPKPGRGGGGLRNTHAEK